MHKTSTRCIQHQLKANSDLFFYLYFGVYSSPSLKSAAQKKKFKKVFLNQISDTCDCHISLVYKVLRKEVEYKKSIYYVANKQAKFDKEGLNKKSVYEDTFIPTEIRFASTRTISYEDFKSFMECILTTRGFKNSSELYGLFIQEAEITPPLSQKTFYRYFKLFLKGEGSTPKVGKFRIIKSKNRKRGYYTAYKEKKNINRPKD